MSTLPPGSAWLPGTNIDAFVTQQPASCPPLPGVRFIGVPLGGWAGSGYQALLSLWNSQGNQCGGSLGILNGKAAVYTSNDGTDASKVSASSATAIPATANGLQILPNSGATAFATSYTTDWGATWTTLGSSTTISTAPYASLDPNTNLIVGNRNSTTTCFTGQLSRLQVIALDGTTVLADLDQRVPWETPRNWRDTLGNLWHRQGPSLPQRVDPVGFAGYYATSASLPPVASVQDGVLATAGGVVYQAIQGAWTAMGGGSTGWAGVTQTGGTTVTNTTAVSPLQTLVIPSSYLTAGARFKLRFYCTLDTAAAGGGYFGRININGSDVTPTVGSSMMINQTSASTGTGVLWDLDLTVLTTGTTGTIALSGPLFSVIAAAGGRGIGAVASAPAWTVDTTSNMTVILKGNMVNANASNNMNPILATAKPA